ncbi:MAG: hypothetical protein ABF289_18395 [Clostridiales bacterium]
MKDTCGNCQFLSLTEKQQNCFKALGLNHRCTLFNKILLHGDSHPELEKFSICSQSTIKKNVIDEIRHFIQKGTD